VVEVVMVEKKREERKSSEGREYKQDVRASLLSALASANHVARLDELSHTLSTSPSSQGRVVLLDLRRSIWSNLVRFD
jgi:hypothetical protein